MATRSSVLAWRIPCPEEPDSPRGCERVGQDLATKQQQFPYEKIISCSTEYRTEHTFNPFILQIKKLSFRGKRPVQVYINQ